MATFNSINGSDNLISGDTQCPVIFVLRVLQSAPSGTTSLDSAFSEATLPREDSDWTSQLNRKSQDAALDAVFVSPTDAVRVSENCSDQTVQKLLVPDRNVQSSAH